MIDGVKEAVHGNGFWSPGLARQASFLAAPDARQRRANSAVTEPAFLARHRKRSYARNRP